ncbi:hypothetical protein [Poseidonibacter ostreae]|uniref:Uncharacterized protein n=1 Tax=Poseidonibacter ostreae TaxID=2654171 RepID=A0ABQ6VPN6_9BACT|nr:hypothetical protein [Poseidonibacter ostreae]KAB7892671.1 hypothetical protein GBG18_02095 [Poseidonibacter ostreae]
METSIVLAIIAGFISFIGLIIAKEQKISEFRQTWIDLLRGDISEFIQELHHFYLSYAIYKSKASNNKDFLENNLQITNQIRYLYYKIKLRLNPNDSDGLIEILDKTILMITSKDEILKNVNFENIVKELDDKSHELFKREWERVKKGEPWFMFAKLRIIAIFCAFIYLKV